MGVVTTEGIIRSLSDLPKGWNFGEGEPIKDNIIQTALKVYKCGLSNDLSAEVFPGLDGTLTLSFQNGFSVLEVTIFGEDDFEVDKEIGIGNKFERKYEGRKNFNDLDAKIQDFANNEKTGGEQDGRDQRFIYKKF